MEDLVLVDTGILFDFMAKRKGFEIFKNMLIQSKVVLSSVTVYELFRGVENKRHKEQRETLISLCEIANFNKGVARLASNIYTDLKKKGSLIPNQDIMIAATGLFLKYPILTNNLKDFKRINGLLIYQQ